MTQMESKPASSAVRTMSPKVRAMAASPPSQVNLAICSPSFMAAV